MIRHPLQPRTGRRLPLALLALAGLAVGAVACSTSSSKAPASAAESTAGYPAPQAQQQYPSGEGLPTAAPPQAPGLDYASPAWTELDLSEKALDLAIAGQDAQGQPLAAGADRCSTVCDALASMRRSAEHVCQLDASRCEDARGRVTRAEERARSACPACGAGG